MVVGSLARVNMAQFVPCQPVQSQGIGHSSVRDAVEDVVYQRVLEPPRDSRTGAATRRLTPHFDRLPFIERAEDVIWNVVSTFCQYAYPLRRH